MSSANGLKSTKGRHSSMAKTLSPEKLQQKKLREEKELKRLLREQEKPKIPGYIIYFIFIISVVYMADEITTQISTLMQSVIGHELFAGWVGEERAVAALGLIGTLCMLMEVPAYFYKTLSDRYGRKLFLVLNTLGMGLGMVLVGLSTNIPTYIIGACCIQFFVPHDMQAIYIQECAPKEKRGRIFSVIKCIATISLLLVPVLRNIFISDNDWSGWRYVYFIPAAVAVIIAVLAAFFVRESDAFLESRIHQLRMTEEERCSAEAKANAENASGGLFKGIALAFKHRQTRWLFICMAILMLGFCITTYYENTMCIGYASVYLPKGVSLSDARLLVTAEVNNALFFFPIGSAIAQLFPGFIADRGGRKRAAVVTSIVCLASFALFSLFAFNQMSPVLVGILAGAAVGSYWAAGDMMELMISESSPTNMRVSIVTARSIVGGVLYLISAAFTSTLANILGDEKIALVCLITAVPGLIAAIVLLGVFVKDTKGADMTEVKFTDYE